MLTQQEHRAMEVTSELWDLLAEIVSDGPARHSDIQELSIHVHSIQNAILSQAAARAYPKLYRLLGGKV